MKHNMWFHPVSPFWPECLTANLLSVVLIANGELLATLGTTRSQYATTILGGHALAEAMLVHAAAIVWLKCSFHCNESLFY